MYCWKISLLLLLLINLTSTITVQNKQIYRLAHNQTTSFSIKIDQAMRYTLIQYQGMVELRIVTEKGDILEKHQEMLYENVIDDELKGSTLNFLLIGGKDVSVGSFTITPVETHEILSYHQEKFVHLRKGETRLIEISPKSKSKLIIQRFDGVPLFINNRCKNYEKKECLDEMHRFTPSEMKKHIDIIDIESCENCLILVKITTNSPNTRLRLSIEAKRTNIQTYPSLVLIKKDQVQHIAIYGEPQTSGKVIIYGGAINLSSETINFYNFPNGFDFTIKSQTQLKEVPHLMTIKGVSQINYLMIQSISSLDDITLIDGLPNTFLIETNKTYSIKYENSNEGKSNIILNGDSLLLERLHIKFINPNTHQTYLIRPKFIFHSTSASQNFQLKQIQQAIHIQIHLVSGESGYLNISSEVNQFIALPLGSSYSSILQYNEYDDFVLEGLSGSIDIQIKKCVDCTVQYEISEVPIKKSLGTPLEAISIVQTRKINNQHLFIRVQTNNFAYYSITVKNHDNKAHNSPTLPHEQVLFYLNEHTEDNLLIQFHPPLCNSAQCSNTKYYLFEGSDYKHLTSKIYCPSSLFNFDERTKDIVFEEIKPTILNGMLSYARPLKQRDYIGIVAEVNSFILPYKVINTEEVKLYKSMRWPFFYLALFITAAVFCSFILFMALRKKSQQDTSGYVRASKSESLEDIS